MKQLTRREALKNVGLTLGGLAFGTQTLANNKNSAVPLEFAPKFPKNLVIHQRSQERATSTRRSLMLCAMAAIHH